MALCMEILSTFEPLFFEFKNLEILAFFVWPAKMGIGGGGGSLNGQNLLSCPKTFC